MNKMLGCCAEEIESAQFLADVVRKPRKCHVSGVQTFARHSFVLAFPTFLPLYLLANFFSMLVVGKPFFCNGPDCKFQKQALKKLYKEIHTINK